MKFFHKLLITLSLAASTQGFGAGPGDGTSKAGVTPYDVGGEVLDIAIFPDKSYLVGGSFINSDGEDNLAHLLSDGSLAPGGWKINDGPDGAVRAISFSRNGQRVYLAGEFLNVGLNERNYVARFSRFGVLDSGFIPPEFTSSASSVQLEAILELPDGKVLVGGFFDGIGTTNTSFLARLNANGSLDTTFNVSPNNIVRHLLLLPDNSVIVSGEFTTVNGVSASRVFKLTPTGAVDTSFNAPTINNVVAEADVQADGKIIIGGSFINLNDYSYIARLNPNGSLDTTFNSQRRPNNNVFAVHVQADQKIVVGGQFDNYAGSGSYVGTFVQRINANGSIDECFRERNANQAVEAITSTADGDLYIGGVFTEAGGANNLSTAILTTTFNEPSDPFEDYLIAAGVPAAQRGPEVDFDGDGQPNLLEFIFGSDPADPLSFGDFVSASSVATGAEINAITPGAGLDVSKRYYTVDIRFPKDLQGVTLNLRATQNLPNFNDSSSSLNQFGSPVDDGEFWIRRHYALPDLDAAPRAFWRFQATQ